MNRDRINRLASKISDILEIETPVNLYDVINKLEGEIQEVDFIENGHEAKVENKKGYFLIKINKNIDSKRKRFSIAHELGHLFYHMKYLIDDQVWGQFEGQSMYRYGTEEPEVEANEFAAAFLMPKNKFENLFYAKKTLKDIAEHFEVSEAAALNRGRHLGLYSWR